MQELKTQPDSGKRPLEIAEVEGMFGMVARVERFAENCFQV
jgi:hypothetical protein